MIFTHLEVEGVYLVSVEKRSDPRGFFARSWCRKEFSSHGLASELAQASIAFSTTKGTLRGLHYQEAPHEEVKLVRCTRGAAYVVALDLRSDSPTYTRWVAAELTAEDHNMLYVPVGCAQGYQTLADDTEMLYQMSQFYAPEAATGVRFDDPAFAIHWPREVSVISEKDLNWPNYNGKDP